MKATEVANHTKRSLESLAREITGRKVIISPFEVLKQLQNNWKEKHAVYLYRNQHNIIPIPKDELLDQMGVKIDEKKDYLIGILTSKHKKTTVFLAEISLIENTICEKPNFLTVNQINF